MLAFLGVALLLWQAPGDGWGVVANGVAADRGALGGFAKQIGAGR